MPVGCARAGSFAENQTARAKKNSAEKEGVKGKDRATISISFAGIPVEGSVIRFA